VKRVRLWLHGRELENAFGADVRQTRQHRIVVDGVWCQIEIAEDEMCRAAVAERLRPTAFPRSTLFPIVAEEAERDSAACGSDGLFLSHCSANQTVRAAFDEGPNVDDALVWLSDTLDQPMSVLVPWHGGTILSDRGQQSVDLRRILTVRIGEKQAGVMVPLPDGSSLQFKGELTGGWIKDEFRRRGIDAADLVCRGMFLEDGAKRIQSK
jgi:hypothetical protein